MIKCATIDFETLDTKPTAHVLSVGVTIFDLEDTNTWGELENNSMFFVFSQHGQTNRTISQSTEQWWHQQDKDIFELARTAPVLYPLEVGAYKIYDFLKDNNVTYLVSNGISFDAAILRDINQTFNIPYPVVYWGDLDLRTMKLMAGINSREIFPPDKRQHHALDDAIHEAVCAQKYHAMCTT